MRVVFDLQEKGGIDINAFPLAVLPFGTGNDLSNSLGWGNNPRSELFRNIDLLVSELLNNTHEEMLNIWEVEAYYRHNGGVSLVDGGKLRTITDQSSNHLKMLMVNYASIGDESMAGI
jgi:diacylglycerol kinase family enzyme